LLLDPVCFELALGDRQMETPNMNPPPIQQYEGQYEYTPGFARKAYMVWLWQRCKWLVVLSMVMLIITFAIGSARESQPTVFFALGVFFILWCSWIGGFRVSGRRAALRRDKIIHLALTSDACTIHSRLMTSSLQWQAFKSVHHRRGIYLLQYHEVSAPTAIPAAALSNEAWEFFLHKVQEAGGLVG
jgi:hypothetical protein